MRVLSFEPTVGGLHGTDRFVEVYVDTVDVLSGLLLGRCVDSVNNCDRRWLVLKAELQRGRLDHSSVEGRHLIA